MFMVDGENEGWRVKNGGELRWLLILYGDINAMNG